MCKDNDWSQDANMCDTVIPQEFVSISDGMACFTSSIVKRVIIEERKVKI